MFQTMLEVDSKGDGKIDNEEWRDYVTQNPSLLKIMTLPFLKLVTFRLFFFIARQFTTQITNLMQVLRKIQFEISYIKLAPFQFERIVPL